MYYCGWTIENKTGGQILNRLKSGTISNLGKIAAACSRPCKCQLEPPLRSPNRNGQRSLAYYNYDRISNVFIYLRLNHLNKSTVHFVGFYCTKLMILWNFFQAPTFCSTTLLTRLKRTVLVFCKETSTTRSLIPFLRISANWRGMP